MTLVVDFERTTNPLVSAWRAVLPDGRLAPPGTDLLRAAWVAVLALLGVVGRAQRSCARRGGADDIGFGR